MAHIRINYNYTCGPGSTEEVARRQYKITWETERFASPSMPHPPHTWHCSSIYSNEIQLQIKIINIRTYGSYIHELRIKDDVAFSSVVSFWPNCRPLLLRVLLLRNRSLLRPVRPRVNPMGLKLHSFVFASCVILTKAIFAIHSATAVLLLTSDTITVPCGLYTTSRS